MPLLCTRGRIVTGNIYEIDCEIGQAPAQDDTVFGIATRRQQQDRLYRLPRLRVESDDSLALKRINSNRPTRYFREIAERPPTAF